MADSWLTDGNCDECRRNKYCHKPCKAHKINTMASVRRAAFTNMVASGTLSATAAIKHVADVIEHDVSKFGDIRRR